MHDAGTTRIGVCWVAAAALGGLLALPAIAQQQSGTQDSSSAQRKQQNQQTSPAKKSAAHENPFPANVSQREAQQQKQQNQQNNAPAAPDAGQQQSGQKPGDAAAENPFPENVSRSAAEAANGNDAGSSSSSSASSSSSNPDGAGNPDADLPPDTGRRKLKKPSDADIQSGSLAGEGKAQEDVRIGRFYLTSGDYKGAYGRFSEAVQLDPTNIDAIYGLAASADGLHHAQEALTNYKLYLEIAPDGHDAKSARKAIRSLSK
jgi:tetratricopeptide (TPR) repeat protein